MRVEVDTSDAGRHLDNLVDGLDADDIHALNVILTKQFIETQMNVHLVTGSLRESGEMNDEHSSKKWDGEISYGGSSHGSPNDPVDYAEHEYKLGIEGYVCPGGRHGNSPYICPGGTHDFLAAAKDSDDEYIVPILDYLRGDD
jgi:hypothetical protein